MYKVRRLVCSCNSFLMETLEDVLPLVFRHLPPAALAACECTCRTFRSVCAMNNHALWKKHVPVSMLEDPLACDNAQGNFKRMAMSHMAAPRILLCQHSSNIAISLPIPKQQISGLTLAQPPPPSFHRNCLFVQNYYPLKGIVQNSHRTTPSGQQKKVIVGDSWR